MKRTLFGLLILLATACSVFKGGPKPPEPMSNAALIRHMAFLAADTLKGRLAGSAGDSLAAEYIARRLNEIQLPPARDDGYFQSFEFIAGSRLDSGNFLHYSSHGQQTALVAGEDYIPLSNSVPGRVAAQLTFAGYGVDSDDPRYSDYDGMQPAGKILLMLPGTPEGGDPAGRMIRLGDPRRKLRTAWEHGAAAVLLIVPDDSSGTPLLPVLSPAMGLAQSPIPAAWITPAAANRLLAEQRLTLEQLTAEIHAARMGVSHDLTGMSASLSIGISEQSATARNVLAILPGRGDLEEQWIILGAHSDHLGYGGWGSRSAVPGETAIHNGADDNASGVAALLEVAAVLAKKPPKAKHRRSILFITYSASETGLLGSALALDSLPVPLDSVVAMVNLDMVGGMVEYTLIAGSEDARPMWDELLKAINHDGLNLVWDRARAGAGDHLPFAWQGVPAITLTTGRHARYHHPDDDLKYMNVSGLRQVGNFVLGMMTSLSVEPTPLGGP